MRYAPHNQIIKVLIVHFCFSVPTLVADLDAQTTLAKAIQEGKLDEVEKVRLLNIKMDSQHADWSTAVTP